MYQAMACLTVPKFWYSETGHRMIHRDKFKEKHG